MHPSPMPPSVAPALPDEIAALLAAARALPKPEILKALRETAELGLLLAQTRADRLEAQGALLLVELGERAAAVLRLDRSPAGR